MVVADPTVEGKGASLASPQLDPGSWNLPTLLHLVQPYALEKVHAAVAHVLRFCTYVRTLSAKQENAQLAKDILIDLVDCERCVPFCSFRGFSLIN